MIDPQDLGAARTSVTAERLAPATDQWMAVPQSPGLSSPGGASVVCAGSRLVLIASARSGAGSVAPFSPEEGVWQIASVSDLTMGATLYGSRGPARVLVGPISGDPFVLTIDGAKAEVGTAAIEGWGEADQVAVIAPAQDGTFIQLTRSLTLSEVA